MVKQESPKKRQSVKLEAPPVLPLPAPTSAPAPAPTPAPPPSPTRKTPHPTEAETRKNKRQRQLQKHQTNGVWWADESGGHIESRNAFRHGELEEIDRELGHVWQFTELQAERKREQPLQQQQEERAEREACIRQVRAEREPMQLEQAERESQAQEWWKQQRQLDESRVEQRQLRTNGGGGGFVRMR